MRKEIEKKYLLSNLPGGLLDGVVIQQGYLFVGDPEVRIRAKDDKYFLTRKGGGGFVRSEEEVEISAGVCMILWPLTEGKQIEKIRFKMPGKDGLVWEIDKYCGRLAGLFTVEVELPDEKTEPIMPDAIVKVLVADVTLDKRYKNKALATAPEPPK